jgi:hypothetical protein
LSDSVQLLVVYKSSELSSWRFGHGVIPSEHHRNQLKSFRSNKWLLSQDDLAAEELFSNSHVILQIFANSETSQKYLATTVREFKHQNTEGYLKNLLRVLEFHYLVGSLDECNCLKIVLNAFFLTQLINLSLKTVSRVTKAQSLTLINAFRTSFVSSTNQKSFGLLLCNFAKNPFGNSSWITLSILCVNPSIIALFSGELNCISELLWEFS